MPRYLLFGGDTYYPGGGWQDFKGSFETPQDALRAATRGWDWWHIVDLESGRIIDVGSREERTSLGAPSKFVIMAKMRGVPKEEVDEAENLEEARYLVREYQMAYGPEWTVWYKRVWS